MLEQLPLVTPNAEVKEAALVSNSSNGVLERNDYFFYKLDQLLAYINRIHIRIGAIKIGIRTSNNRARFISNRNNET